MFELILASVILALCINGIYIVFNWENMLLFNFGLLLESYLPQWLCKMLFMCATCMSGIYGLVTYLSLFAKDFIELIAFIAMTACLSTLVNIFLECAQALKELADNDLGRNIKL